MVHCSCTFTLSNHNCIPFVSICCPDNKISKIPAKALAGLPNLEWLDLSKNKLDDASFSPLLFQVSPRSHKHHHSTSALQHCLTFTCSHTHSYTDGGDSHARQQPAGREQLGLGVLLRDT